MKIVDIETYAVGAGWKNWLFVRVLTDSGIYGIGEGTLNGFIKTTEAGVHELKHLAIGQDPTRIHALAKRLLDSVSLDGGHIHRTIIAAVEVACWDILGKQLGVPIHQLLGGRVRDSVLGYANGWYRTERTPEAFLEAARGVLDKGFKALKLDPFGTAQGFISRSELDLSYDICRMLRDKLPKGTEILIDVHARFTEIAALQAAERFADLDIYWWEEPTTRDRQEAVHRAEFGGCQFGAVPWQLYCAAPVGRPCRHGGVPAIGGGGAQLPDPGTLRRLQRPLDAHAHDLAPQRRSGDRPSVAPRWAGARDRPRSGRGAGPPIRSQGLPQRPR
jgi:hypothetical protein